MKLQQGQIWRQKDNTHLRIVYRDNLSVEYKKITNLETKEGTHHQARKKEFCRLLKGAVLLNPSPTADPEIEVEEEAPAAVTSETPTQTAITDRKEAKGD